MSVVTISARGQLVIPAHLRKRYQLETGAKVLWIDTGKTLLLMPVVQDPVKASRGFLRGARLTRALLRAREGDKAKEEAKVEGRGR